MNLRMVAKNHPADQKIEFVTKSISKPYGRATGMSPAWELRNHRYFKFLQHVHLKGNGQLAVFPQITG